MKHFTRVDGMQALQGSILDDMDVKVLESVVVLRCKHGHVISKEYSKINPFPLSKFNVVWR
jgi:hypothetical protein